MCLSWNRQALRRLCLDRTFLTRSIGKFIDLGHSSRRLFHTKQPQIEFTFCRCWVLNLGDLYAPMSDDDEVLPVTYASHLNMDAAFCSRMCAAIAARLES